MPKPADLAVVLEQAGRGAVRTALPASQPTRRRAKTVALTIHVDPEIRRQVRQIAADEDRTVHALVCEGLNAMFARAGRPEIAR